MADFQDGIRDAAGRRVHRIAVTALAISTIACEQSYWVQRSAYDRYQALPETDKDRAALEAVRADGGERVYVRARDLKLDPLDPVPGFLARRATVERTHPLVLSGFLVALASVAAIVATGISWSHDEAERRLSQDACRQTSPWCFDFDFSAYQYAPLLAFESASLVAGIAMLIAGGTRHPGEVAHDRTGIAYVDAAATRRSKHLDGKAAPPPALPVPTLPTP